jgi:predicted O-methyltransferase YrrM
VGGTTSKLESVWAWASGIQGWLSDGQARALAEAAEKAPPGSAIVEIGSHHGRSTVVLGSTKPAGVRLLAIDPFDDPRWGGGQDSYGVLQDNLTRAGLDGEVEIFRGTSEQAADHWDGSPVGMLFVDGAHDRRSVLLDLDRWEPFVVDGGVVCLHDAFSSPGVTLALLQRHLLSRSFRYIGSVRSLAMLRREHLSPLAVPVSGLRLLSRLGYFARNALIKVAMRRGWEAPQRLLGHREPGFPY